MELKAILKQPYTDKEREDFIVEQNHNLRYEIRQVETTYEVEVEVPYTELETEEIQVAILDEGGNPVLDDEENPTFKTQTIEKEIVKYRTETVEKTGYNLEAWGNTDDEKLKQAQTAKLQEASDKAFEYRNVTGLVSFNARPVDTSLLAEGETTLILHTELLNQNDFFQRMTGFSTGMFTDDIIYNTKEDILVYLNAEETQAIYYAIIDKAGRLWNEDYMTYKALIEGCTTAEEVEQIVIDYDNVPVIEDEVTDENTTDYNQSDIQDENTTDTDAYSYDDI